MANSKVSDLPNKATPVGTEEVHIADAGVSKKATLDAIFAALGSSGGGLTAWNADPVVVLPDDTSVIEGTYDQVTQTLTVSGTPAASAAATNGGIPAGAIQGCVAFLDQTDVIDPSFSNMAVIKPQFDSSTGGGAPGAATVCGWVPTTASTQDVLDMFAAFFGMNALDIPVNCPWFWQAGFIEGPLIGGAAGSINQFWDGTSSMNAVAGTTPTLVTNVEVASTFGYGTDSTANAVIQSAATYVVSSVETEQSGASLLNSAVSLNGVSAKFFVGAFSIDAAGVTHNVANQTAIFDFSDATYNPLQLLAGSTAATASTRHDASNLLQTDYDGVFGTSALFGSSSPPALPAADFVQASVTGADYAGYSTTISDEWVYASNQVDTLWPLNNDDVAALIATNTANVATNTATLDAQVTGAATVNASTTGGQGSTPLTAAVNLITAAVGAGADVTLPAASAGKRVIVHNQNSGSHTVDVYVASGDSLNDLNGTTVDGLIAMEWGRGLEFVAVDDTEWMYHGTPAATSIGSDDVTNQSTVSGSAVSDALETNATAIGAIPVINGSDDVPNDSTVSGAAVSDALETLDAQSTEISMVAIDTAGSIETALQLYGETTPHIIHVQSDISGAEATQIVNARNFAINGFNQKSLVGHVHYVAGATGVRPKPGITIQSGTVSFNSYSARFNEIKNCNLILDPDDTGGTGGEIAITRVEDCDILDQNPSAATQWYAYSYYGHNVITADSTTSQFVTPQTVGLTVHGSLTLSKSSVGNRFFIQDDAGGTAIIHNYGTLTIDSDVLQGSDNVTINNHGLVVVDPTTQTSHGGTITINHFTGSDSLGNDSGVTGADVSAALDQLDTDIGTATTHVSSNGSDHSYIDQSVTTGASPQFFDVSVMEYFTHSTTTAIAAAGTTQGAGTALITEINEITSVTAASAEAVVLPNNVAGRSVLVINNDGADTLKVFPASGDDAGNGVDASVDIVAGSHIRFTAYDGTNWVQE